ncbi:uncharacterized protein LOC117584908 [Drosophila guanche]|uniref:uncharacterized protein LOC117584908 n=1 Tax=Drosophila guanche TaxID=7266 RepID=UPI0014720C35|nr:uncharacterized protein LOC117584908 [Drosophila guanche]
MQRSLLLLSLAAIVLSAAMALPLSVEESAERGSSLESEMEMEKELAESVESEEILKTGWDSSEGTVPKAIVKRSPEEAAAKDASSSSEEHGKDKDKDKDKAKAKADSSGESSEEAKKKEQPAEAEPEKAGRRRRQAIKDPQSVENVNDEADEYVDPPGQDSQAEKEDGAALDVLPPDNTSIEDYAQGCEVMEVNSKEANETTYFE